MHPDCPQNTGSILDSQNVNLPHYTKYLDVEQGQVSRLPCVRGAVCRQADKGLTSASYQTIPPTRLTPGHLPLHKGGFA